MIRRDVRCVSNRIVGWKTSDRCDTSLVLGALEHGLWSREVRNGGFIHHSDRGSTYTSIRFAQRLANNGILPSMGSVGDSYDNALMESFFSMLKIELVYRNSWRTRDEAENAIFSYIDGWYNTQRIQKEFGCPSADEYKAAWHADQHKPSIPASPAGARWSTLRVLGGTSSSSVHAHGGLHLHGVSDLVISANTFPVCTRVCVP